MGHPICDEDTTFQTWQNKICVLIKHIIYEILKTFFDPHCIKPNYHFSIMQIKFTRKYYAKKIMNLIISQHFYAKNNILCPCFSNLIFHWRIIKFIWSFCPAYFWFLVEELNCKQIRKNKVVLLCTFLKIWYCEFFQWLLVFLIDLIFGI